MLKALQQQASVADEQCFDVWVRIMTMTMTMTMIGTEAETATTVMKQLHN